MSRDNRQVERALTEEILERVRKIAALRNEPQPFTPGVTPVKYAGRVYDEEDMVALAESAVEFWLTAGRWHRRLEEGLAKWYGVAAARLVNSGSSANLTAIAALMSPTWAERRLKRGDQVITVAAGFPTTVAPILQLGAVPVFVDVSLPTANIDVSFLEAARTERTRAVVLAHTLGNPFDLDAVTAFCKAHDLWLVEDNCDAAGSSYRERKTGTFGDVATLSFYPPHHMTTGEGGMLTTADGELAERARLLREHGMKVRYHHDVLGYNFRMTDVHAAIGLAQLPKLPAHNQRRRQIAARYDAELRGVITPAVRPGVTHVYHQYTIRVARRDEFAEALRERGVGSGIYYPIPVHRQKPFMALGYGDQRFGVTEQLAEQVLSIPVHPSLSDEEVSAVIDAVNAVAGELGPLSGEAPA